MAGGAGASGCRHSPCRPSYVPHLSAWRASVGLSLYWGELEAARGPPPAAGPQRDDPEVGAMRDADARAGRLAPSCRTRLDDPAFLPRCAGRSRQGARMEHGWGHRWSTIGSRSGCDPPAIGLRSAHRPPAIGPRWAHEPPTIPPRSLHDPPTIGARLERDRSAHSAALTKPKELLDTDHPLVSAALSVPTSTIDWSFEPMRAPIALRSREDRALIAGRARKDRALIAGRAREDQALLADRSRPDRGIYLGLPLGGLIGSAAPDRASQRPVVRRRRNPLLPRQSARPALA